MIQGIRIDGLKLVTILFILFLGTRLLPHNNTARAEESSLPTPTAFQPVSQPTADAVGQGQPAQDTSFDNPDSVIAPYETYVVTQGLHGFSYGQAAVDLAAGQGAEILSPINGEVAELYVDQYGNPTLIIENELYRITLLHGDYIVAVGDRLQQGQVVGYESNHGYTTDYNGNLCYEREGCGYHSHINIFDKNLGENANPFELFDR